MTISFSGHHFPRNNSVTEATENEESVTTFETVETIQILRRQEK